MAYTSKQLEQLVNGSESTKRRNAGLLGLGSLPNTERKSRQVETLDGAHERKKAGPESVRHRVVIVSVRSKELDDDNLQSGAKSIRDSIASHFGVDDSKKHFDFEYHQIISKTQGTLVLIEEL